MKKEVSSLVSQALHSRNRALLLALVGLVTVFYVVSFIRTGEALRLSIPAHPPSVRNVDSSWRGRPSGPTVVIQAFILGY